MIEETLTSPITIKVLSNVIVERMGRQRMWLRNERKNAMRRAANARKRGEDSSERHRSVELLAEMRKLDAAIDIFSQAPGMYFDISLEEAGDFGFGLGLNGGQQAIG